MKCKTAVFLILSATIAAHGAERLIAAASDINGQTSVPLGAVLGSAATVFLVGMWVSRKVTRFEEQQQMNMKRLDLIEARLFHIEEGKRK